MLVTFPYIMRSEANTRSHWAARHRRASEGRELATLYLRMVMATEPAPEMPVVVTLTRISPRQLDEDNLSRAFKAIRDGVADALLPTNVGNQHRRWADDSDGQILWLYAQRKGEPKEHAVEIKIEPKGTD